MFINSNISYFSNSSVRSIEGESFEAFYDIPNINERNNVLLLDDGATSYPVTVAEGTYDYNDLATALEASLNLLGIGVFTVDWDTVNKNKFTIGCPVALKVTNYEIQRRDLGELMGFTKDLPLSLTLLGSCPDLTYTRNIYVTSDSLHNRKRIDDQTSTPLLNNLMMVVPVHWNEYYNVAELSPRNIYHQPNIPKKINFDDTTTISNVDIRLFDDQGEIMYVPKDSPHCLRWRLTLNISRDV